MAWLKLHQSLKEHPKVLQLAESIGISVPETIGRLVLLWLWCLDYADDGVITRYEHGTIHKVCGISVDKLIDCGFVDTGNDDKIHDWLDYVGEYLRGKYRFQPEKYARIKSRYKTRNKHGNSNHKIKIKTDKIKTDLDMKKKKFVKPNPDEVSEYAKTIGFDLDGNNFCDFYESKGWKIGSSPMKDWMAAVRTWKKRGNSGQPERKSGQYLENTGKEQPGKFSGIGKTIEV